VDRVPVVAAEALVPLKSSEKHDSFVDEFRETREGEDVSAGADCAAPLILGFVPALPTALVVGVLRESLRLLLGEGEIPLDLVGGWIPDLCDEDRETGVRIRDTEVAASSVGTEESGALSRHTVHYCEHGAVLLPLRPRVAKDWWIASKANGHLNTPIWKNACRPAIGIYGRQVCY